MNGQPINHEVWVYKCIQSFCPKSIKFFFKVLGDAITTLDADFFIHLDNRGEHPMNDRGTTQSHKKAKANTELL